ncbi:hypothetical protein BDY24DRAFT_377822 [Mrakia frigida]|uniref:uncharacterized protein n=1 Tax=Mrakia frigida TaxID=29902 RepID=UPI003FCC2117
MASFSSPSASPSAGSGSLPVTRNPSTSGPSTGFPFVLANWKAVDDRVRGGSSVSHLDAVEGGFKFWGTLDTQTLGGAGFASQSYTFDTPLSLPLSLYTGLLVRLLPPPSSSSKPLPDVEKGRPKKPTRITVILKTEEPKKRKDGRNEAVVSWEADFDVEEVLRRAAGEEASSELNEKFTTPADTSSTSLTNYPSSPSSALSSTAASSPKVRLPFSAFVPTYRGRPIPAPAPGVPPPFLDPEHITALSLMCRSNFGEQEGEYECFIAGLEAVERGAWSQENGRKKGVKEIGWGAWFWSFLLKLVGRG